MVKEIHGFLKEIILKLPIILKLSIEDFKKRFSGSSFGVVWSLIQPIVTIGVFWMVFTVGFRSSNVKDVPFICWMMSGLVPWYYFSEVVSSASNSLLEYKFILKQMSFNPSVIPLIKIISSLATHSIFVVIMTIVMILNGVTPNMYWLQIPYYFMCMFILLLGLSWLTSSIKVFFYDIGEIILVILQIGMWLTPILWDFSMVSSNMQWLFKINPFFYIIQGYRDSLIYNISIVDRIGISIYFWIVCLIILLLGAVVFSKLRHYFNDVI